MRLTRTFNAGHDNLYLNKDDVNQLLKGQMLKESSLIVQMENPEREWVGLTENEIHECFEECCNLKVVDPKGGVRGSVNIFDVGMAIEAKLKEKNK